MSNETTCAALNSCMVPHITLINEGDIVTLDIPGRKLNVKLTDEELAERKSKWKPIPPNYTSGALAKYAKLVSSASLGAVTH